ncbi:TraC family protein [Ralstonia pseudosolanacearum]|uniref:Conjugal transfer protein TraC n=1 Tax=Ralstonia pseudosolanacearum TaxID=1310165 RepID=A0A454TLP9_9RALS|nr:TraC family protein [Ralstonia pseudosolanacearum]RNM03038.1 conjugal transfer protein TraC [Ralstonia pseudosolanacearum]
MSLFKSKRTVPASSVVNLETYTEDTNLMVSKFHTDRPYVGAVYSMSPLSGGGGEFSTVVQNVFKAVPDDSVIQVSLLVAPDHDVPEAFAKGKVHGGPVVQELIARQKTLLTQALSTGTLVDMPLINCRRVFMSLAVPNRKVDDEALDSADHLQNEFLTNLKDCGFHDAYRMNAGQLAGVYRQFARVYQPYEEVDLDQVLDLRLQIYGTDEEFDFSDKRIGTLSDNTYCGVVTTKSYPVEPFHGIMNLVSGAPFNKGPTAEGGGQRLGTPFLITTTVRVANQRREQTRMDSAIRSRKTNQNLPIKLGSEDPIAKLSDLEALNKKVSEDGNKYVFASTNIFVFGRTRDEVISGTSTVKNTLDKLGFDGRDVLGTGLVRWAQALPMNFASTIADKLKGEAVMAASDVGCLLAVYGDFLGNVNKKFPTTGATYLTRRGSGFHFDPFVSNSNYCGVQAAMSGSGKSFDLQYQINCDLADGSWVVLFDNGGSNKKYCHAVGGEYNEFGGNGYHPSLTPFTGLTSDEFNEQQETITSLMLLMAYDNETPDPGARIAANEAVKAAWGKAGDKAEISTVIYALESTVQASIENEIKSQVEIAAVNLIPRLKAFIESPTRGVYFRGPSSLDPTKQLTVFEIGKLGDDAHLKRCVVFCCLNTLMTRVKSIKGRKRIYVDEAQDLIKVPAAADALEGLYLKGRKDEIAVWLIVQSLLKLAEYPAGQVILRQSAWKVVMAQEAEEIDAVVDKKILSAFSNDAYFNRLLRSVESRKGFWSEKLIMGDNTYEVCRLYVDRFTATLFSSEGAERTGVFALMEEGWNVIDAVNKIMGDTKTRRTEWMKRFLQMCTEHDGLSGQEIVKELKELIK